MKKNTAATVLAALGIALTGAAQADDVSSPWIVRLGMHDVDPKSNNHAVVNVGSAKSLRFNVTRMLDEHWGVELLAALPFEHDIYLNTGGKVADVKHLPPTLSAQYHFAPGAKIPYTVAVGRFQPFSLALGTFGNWGERAVPKAISARSLPSSIMPLTPPPGEPATSCTSLRSSAWMKAAWAA